MLVNLAADNAGSGLSALLDRYRLVVALYVTLCGLMLLMFKCYDDPLRDYSLFSASKAAGA
ncbi:MAG: hypothetical protein GXY11_01370, partial [Clostridiales bacterium]|nr:hypothetical protein [Clostridiales bacterium]